MPALKYADGVSMRKRVASSRIAPLAAFPARFVTVGRHDARMLRRSLRWLIASREHTNFTYPLSERNLDHLAWWVATVADIPLPDARGYLREPENDLELLRHIGTTVSASRRRGLADRNVHFGRRLGWYGLVRAMRPSHVVETGTDKGLGSCLLASALIKNGSGRLTTIDVNPDSGYLIAGPYAAVIDRALGDSVKVLAEIEESDFLIHDSWHSFEHEAAEYESAPIAKRGLVLSDNAHASGALAQWAERTGRWFLFFDERPDDHWYPGAGIGAAWHRS